MDDPAVQVALALASALVLALLLGSVAWSVSRSRARDRARVAEVERCFAAIATRYALCLERPAPLEHPVLGRVPLAPSLRGAIEGLSLRLAVEADPARDGDLATTLRLARPRDEPWLVPSELVGEARESLERLSKAGHAVELGPEALVVVPWARREIDMNGNSHRIETDPERLARALDDALALARALRVRSVP